MVNVVVGCWYMLLKNGMRFGFYHDGDAETSPLLRIKDFDCGDCWEIDADADEKSRSKFETSEDDDSFVKIPKAEVVKVYFQRYEQDNEICT